MRLRLLKTLLWFLVGFGLVVLFFRIMHGVGSVVALNNILPWGLWKGGGVVALVPIGGAGFTLAAMVYIFHWERYRPLARGGVLLGLACYTSVAVGLTFDIGIWWRIVFPVFHWHLHSALFEIAWCIMLYLGVLVVEFSHAVLERLNFPRLLKVVEKASIVFVILGISLSTLHQSSLGTLFLATPYRLHPLWYSDLLPLLFLITAIGLGCLTISFIALLAHKLYDVEPPMKAISGLGRISAIFMGLYLAVRFADLLLTGKGALLAVPAWETALFWAEILLSAAIPALFMTRRSVRQSQRAMFWLSAMAIFGMSLNRINVAGLATTGLTDHGYFPIWPEWAMTSGILAAAGLACLYLVEHFEVFEAIDDEAVKRAYAPARVNPADWKTTFFHNPLSSARVYSMALVTALGMAAFCLPSSAVYGVKPEKVATRAPRSVQIQKVATEPGKASRFIFPASTKEHPETPATEALLLDADDNGRFVLFMHQAHIDRLKKDGQDCGACHHMNEPLARATTCSACHTDMYQSNDIFSHKAHVKHLKGNEGCAKCHTDPALPRTAKNTTPCADCHVGMRARESLVSPDGKPANLAIGYKAAMHSLCIDCHKRGEDKFEGLASCTTCHRDTPRLSKMVRAKHGDDGPVDAAATEDAGR